LVNALVGKMGEVSLRTFTNLARITILPKVGRTNSKPGRKLLPGFLKVGIPGEDLKRG